MNVTLVIMWFTSAEIAFSDDVNLSKILDVFFADNFVKSRYPYPDEIFTHNFESADLKEFDVGHLILYIADTFWKVFDSISDHYGWNIIKK